MRYSRRLARGLVLETLENRVVYAVGPIVFGSAFPGAEPHSNGLSYGVIEAEIPPLAKIIGGIDQTVDGVGGTTLRVNDSSVNRMVFASDAETDGLHWLAAAPGTHTIDGKLVQVGENTAAPPTGSVTFPQSFSAAPVVLLMIKANMATAQPSDIRVVGNPSNTGFQYQATTATGQFTLEWVAMEEGLYIGDDFVWSAARIPNQISSPTVTFVYSLAPVRAGVIATVHDADSSGASRAYLYQQDTMASRFRLLSSGNNLTPSEYLNCVAFVSKSDYQQDVIWDQSAAVGALTLRKSGSNLVLLDSGNATVATTPIASTKSLTIRANNLRLDLSSGGAFSLPGGLSIERTGAGPVTRLVGTGATRARYETSFGENRADVTLTEFGVAVPVSLNVKVNGLSDISITNLLSFAGSGELTVSQELLISSATVVDLPTLTQVTGTLISASTLSLGSGETLMGNGIVFGPVAGDIGSSITATGSLSLGLGSSTIGFMTRGELVVGGANVSLLDSNQAVLGALTSLGQSATPGTLNAANGALIDFGNNLVGYGTLNTANLSTKPTVINGAVEGTSLALPVTLTGYIKGVGTLNNVSIAGTYSPGFSPAAVTLGNTQYATSSKTIVELGGTTPGTQYDQLNHQGQALLGGELQVELIGGFVPAIGDSFTIITATGGVTGQFATATLPTPPLGSGWHVNYSANQVRLELKKLADVNSTRLGDGTAQHSKIDRLVIQFDGQVDIEAGAISLSKRGNGGALVTSSLSTVINGSGNTVATLTFSGALTRGGGVLVDGYYQLTIDSSKIRLSGTQLALDGDGNGLAGGNLVRGDVATDNFFALYGDTDGDGIVGVAEFGQFRNAFGKSSSDAGYNSLFDYEGDNSIGVSDFGQFRSRFGKPKIVFA